MVVAVLGKHPLNISSVTVVSTVWKPIRCKTFRLNVLTETSSRMFSLGLNSICLWSKCLFPMILFSEFLLLRLSDAQPFSLYSCSAIDFTWRWCVCSAFRFSSIADGSSSPTVCQYTHQVGFARCNLWRLGMSQEGRMRFVEACSTAIEQA